MWHDLLVSGISLTEKTIRTLAVYVAIVVLLRVFGKRDLAELNTFDLVVMLMLSNVVQNAVIGPDNSVSGALFGAAVLLATNSVVVKLAARQPWLERLFEGTATVLAKDGVYDRKAISRLGLRAADVDVAIKRQGGDHVSDTSLVTLEPGGTVLVRLRREEEAASTGEVEKLGGRLDGMDARLARIETLLSRR